MAAQAIRRVRALALLLVAAACAAQAAPPRQVRIPSLDGKQQIPAWWFPAAADEPRPAIIDLHGCGGALDANGRLGQRWRRDARWFEQEKMHLLVPDSFSSRGVKSLCEQRVRDRAVDLHTRRDDVFAALQWLARQPGVDATRIALLGRSNGGSTVLAALDRSDPEVRAQRIQPRAAIAFYPGCRSFAAQRGYELTAPLLLMIGELDDWTSAARCVELHDKLQRGFDLVVFPRSHHGFDGVGAIRVRPNLPTPSGVATVGANPLARRESHRRLFEFLSEKLDTPLAVSHERRQGLE